MHLHEQQSQVCDVRLLCFYLAFIKKYKLLPKLNKTPQPTAECQIFIICGVIILARNSRCAQRKHDSRNDKFTAYAMLALLFHTIFTKFTAKSGQKKMSRQNPNLMFTAIFTHCAMHNIINASTHFSQADLQLLQSCSQMYPILLHTTSLKFIHIFKRLLNCSFFSFKKSPGMYTLQELTSTFVSTSLHLRTCFMLLRSFLPLAVKVKVSLVFWSNSKQFACQWRMRYACIYLLLHE